MYTTSEIALDAEVLEGHRYIALSTIMDARLVRHEPEGSWSPPSPGRTGR